MKFLNIQNKKIEKYYNDNYTTIHFQPISPEIYELKLPQYKTFFYNLFSDAITTPLDAKIPYLFRFSFTEKDDLNEFLLATLLRYFIDFLCEEEVIEQRLGAPIGLEEKVFLNYNKLNQLFTYKTKINLFNVIVDLKTGEQYEML